LQALPRATRILRAQWVSPHQGISISISKIFANFLLKCCSHRTLALAFQKNLPILPRRRPNLEVICQHLWGYQQIKQILPSSSATSILNQFTTNWRLETCQIIVKLLHIVYTLLYSCSMPLFKQKSYLKRSINNGDTNLSQLWISLTRLRQLSWLNYFLIVVGGRLHEPTAGVKWFWMELY